MQWQEWIVALIGLGVVAYLAKNLYCLVRGGGSKCGSCTADCPLKRQTQSPSKKE